MGLSREQIQASTREELTALPIVAKRLDDAAEQARRYGAALCKRYGLTDLRLFTVVGIGLERVVWQDISVLEVEVWIECLDDRVYSSPHPVVNF
ncbi:hypothetical protein CCP3SC15_5140002 [Gammaproteobacteria bacterium]